MRADIGLVLILTLILSVVPGRSEDNPPAKDEAVDMAPTSPSIELLEFLGAWETDDGEWVDPAILDDSSPSDQESSDD